MTVDKAEEWIVNLIRNARLDAAIDSKEGHVVMTTQVPSVYHQVIEKTKSLSFRSQALSDSIQKLRVRRPGAKRDGPTQVRAFSCCYCSLIVLFLDFAFPVNIVFISFSPIPTPTPTPPVSKNSIISQMIRHRFASFLKLHGMT